MRRLQRELSGPTARNIYVLGVVCGQMSENADRQQRTSGLYSCTVSGKKLRDPALCNHAPPSPLTFFRLQMRTMGHEHPTIRIRYLNAQARTHFTCQVPKPPPISPVTRSWFHAAGVLGGGGVPANDLDFSRCSRSPMDMMIAVSGKMDARHLPSRVKVAKISESCRVEIRTCGILMRGATAWRWTLILKCPTFGFPAPHPKMSDANGAC